MKKIILCRTSWMKYYNGHANIDIPRSGAKWILKHKTGGEIYNFKNQKGKAFAYFPSITDVGLHNLGAERKADHLDDVTVVFCARHPVEGGIRVVGWYKNAKVFRTYQTYFKSHHQKQWFHTTTNYKNTVLIPEDDRILRLPDTFGRSSLYYIATHSNKKGLLRTLEDYISRGCKKMSIKQSEDAKSGKRKIGKLWPRQPDIGKRLKVERKGMLIAKRYYGERYGIENVKPVDKENKGWDIEVKASGKTLNVEVKGLSGSELNVELTPNEYRVFKQAKSNYHLFVVNNALMRKPVCRVFRYQQKGNIWTANDKSILSIIEIKGARLNIK